MQNLKTSLHHYKIALVIYNLGGGGAERVFVNLANYFSQQGINTSLLLVHKEGPLLNDVNQGIDIIDLGGSYPAALIQLIKWVRKEKPQAILSALNVVNVLSILAGKLSFQDVNIVISQHVHMTAHAQNSKHIRSKMFIPLGRFVFPYADTAIAVSKEAGSVLQQIIKKPESWVKTIYNPYQIEKIISASEDQSPHIWLSETKNEIPIFISVGRLDPQKDYKTLISAFALLRQKRKARLIILGEGDERHDLEALIAKHKLTEDILLPGFVRNPYAWVARADCFVLSSRWEGFPSVLVEALALGVAIVSTDCPSGPKEALDNGKYGTLVPVGDIDKLCQEMINVIDKPVDRKKLSERARQFDVPTIGDQYIKILLKNDD